MRNFCLNEQQILISIIMPVYNSSKYLKKAIDSICGQTFESWELILVDDGSTDGSEKICDEYLEREQKIKVIHSENKGACSARNIGVYEAKGLWIAFIDDDDIYEKEFLEKMFEVSKLYNADLIKCGRMNIYIDNNEKSYRQIKCSVKKVEVLSNEEFVENYFDYRKSGVLSPVWNGMYKKEIIDKYNIRFDETLKHGNEDIIFNSEYISKCKNITLLPDILYYHFIRKIHSTSMKVCYDQIETRMVAIESEQKLIDSFPCKNNNREILELQGIRECLDLLCMLSSEDKKRKNEILNTIKFNKTLDKYDIFKLFHTLPFTAAVDLMLIKYRIYGLRMLIFKLKNK